MVRPRLRPWLAGFFLLGLVLLGGLGWLGWSSSGARWLLTLVAQQLPGGLSVDSCSGRLADRLVITGLDYREGGSRVSLSRLELTWQPLALLRGQVRVVRLTAAGVVVRLPRPSVAKPAPEAVDWRWPTGMAGPRWLRVDLEHLVVTGVSLLHGDSRLLALDRIVGALSWHGAELVARGLQLSGPDGGLQADLMVNLRSRRGRVTLAVTPAAKGRLQGMPAGRLQLRLAGGNARQLLRGKLQVAAIWGDEPELRLASDFVLEPRLLTLRQLQLSRAGFAGSARGRGRVDFTAAGPALGLDLELSAVDLTPQTRFQTAVSGRLRGQVDGRGYRGEFDLSNAGKGWRRLSLAGQFDGDAGRVLLHGLQGDWLRGKVTGKLRIDWSGAPYLEGAFSGSGLDPAALDSSWPGRLNPQLEGRLDFPRGQGLLARWRIKLAASQMRGLPLQGSASGRYAEADLELKELRLESPGARLTARGKLAERLDFSLRAARLASLGPGLVGSGQLQGWLRWSPRRGWAGEVAGTGDKLAYGEWSLRRLALQGRLLPEANTLALSAKVAGVHHGVWTIDQASVSGQGGIDSHRLGVVMRWPSGHGELNLEGGWVDGSWRGQLQSLAAEFKGYGAWQLEQPVTLDLGPAHLAWSELHLEGAAGESLRSRGKLQLQPLGGTSSLDLHRFSLGWLNPWLSGIDLGGMAGGHLDLHWQQGRLTDVAGALAGHGLWRQGERVLAVEDLAARLVWNHRGLDGSWRIDLGKQGYCRGKVASRMAPQWALPRRGRLDLDWQLPDLALANPWLSRFQLGGHLAGSASIDWEEEQTPRFRLQVAGAPQVLVDGATIAFQRTDLDAVWDNSGLRGSLSLVSHGGGRLSGQLQAPEAAHLGWPRQGTFAFDGGGIDLALAQRWLPGGLVLDGRVKLSGKGRWDPGGRFAADGDVALAKGRARWRSGKRELSAILNTLRLDWRWGDQALAGDLVLELGEQGALAGHLQIPLPARFPLAPVGGGPLQGHLQGQLREDGLLGSLFPSVVQETRGRLDLNLVLAGTWARPRLKGKARLAGAGAYLPTLGVRLQDAGLQLQLENDQVTVQEIKLTSGKGVLHGSGSVALDGLVPGAYSFQLKGDAVQALNLPELQLSASPDLEVSGQGRQLQVNGSLKIPDALFRGRQGKAPIASSEDLVIVDSTGSARPAPPLTVALKVQIELGEHVLVKAEGVDARLSGKVLVFGPDLNSLKGQGRIEVAKGDYATYGVRLAITRGSVVFAGGPVAEPSLDILALRTIGEVKAGVHVTGTPRSPQVKLYSEPSMPDTDVLAYVVLGHPMGADSSQASLMMVAAGALLSQGDSAVLQDRLKRQLGIDVIDVQTGKGDTAASVVTIGKYLSPKLYVSFGQSVFSNTSEVGLRYEMGKHWQVESNVGTESGIDLFYRITFE